MKYLVLMTCLFSANAYGLEAQCKYKNNHSFAVNLKSIGFRKRYDSYYDETLKSAGFKLEEVVRGSIYTCEATSDKLLTMTCTFKNGKTRTLEMNSIKFGTQKVTKYSHDGYDFWEEVKPFVSIPVSLGISTTVKNYDCKLNI